jgi:hypothetical protein
MNNNFDLAYKNLFFTRSDYYDILFWRYYYLEFNGAIHS